MYQKWLEAFHFVANEGSFTGAANRLHVGQPTISTHVKNLEARFGVELFHRQGRSITLTSTGKSLYAITHNLYGHEQEAIAYLTSAKALDVGELNLSAVGPHDVIELLAEQKKHRPGIEFSVRLALIEEVLADIHDFRADIGVIGRDCGSETIHSMFYNRHRILVAVNQQHRLAARKQIQLSDLEGEKMVMRTKSSTTQEAFDLAVEKVGIKINPVLQIESREGLREAIIWGFGIGVISETEYSPHSDLHALSVTDADMYTRAYLVCLKSRRNRPLIQDFFSLASKLAERSGYAAKGP